MLLYAGLLIGFPARTDFGMPILSGGTTLPFIVIGDPDFTVSPEELIRMRVGTVSL